MRRIQISEIELIDILGCSVTRLQLDPNKMVTVLQSENDVATPVPIALELMCTRKYDTANKLFKLKSSFGDRACVRIIFFVRKYLLNESEGRANDLDDVEDDDDTPCTSREALRREERRRQRRNALAQQLCTVRAERHLNDSPEHILYTVDDGDSHTVTVVDFYERFFKSYEYVLPHLMHLYNFCYGNWLPLLSIDGNAAATTRGGDGNPFDVFAKLFMKNRYTTRDFLGLLTKNCLRSAEFANAVKRHALLKIFKYVRTIFEYITCLEYTAWFFIPRLNQYRDISNVGLDDLNFTEIKTCIQLRSDQTRCGEPGEFYIWRDAEHGVRDLLMIAFQLALAYSCHQNFVVLRNLASLRDYQCLKYATAAYVQQTYKDSDVKWTCHNYLQRVVDVGIQLNLNTFIEYPGGLPQSPHNANCVRCKQNATDGNWLINVAAGSDYNIEALFETIEDELCDRT